MSDNHAHARTREAAARWLARDKPLSDATLRGPNRQRIFDAFAAGAEWAISPQSEEAVDAALVDLLRGAESTEDAAARVKAFFGAIHRGEQDLWHERFAAAGELIAESAGLFREYEAHHRAKIDTEERDVRTHRAERNGKIADKLERWLLDRNPAEVLRQAAVGMVDGETIKGVDHASFDRAAAMCNEIVVSHVPPGKMGEADVAAQEAMVGAALDAGIDQIGEADEPPPSGRHWIDHERSRAGLPPRDPAPFAITTGDPRFDPAAPVIINGYRYHPAKENEHG